MQAGTQEHGPVEVACGLSEEIVRTFGEVRLRVNGTSMAPSILPGDVVSIAQANLENVAPGEVVSFLQGGRLFVHRVVRREAPAKNTLAGTSLLITRGDRLQHEDPPVSGTELLGRVVVLERGGHKVKLLPQRSNSLIALTLQSSDRATYLYVKAANLWRSIDFRPGFKRGFRRAKCQV
jgi:hypothetical protein